MSSYRPQAGAAGDPNMGTCRECGEHRLLVGGLVCHPCDDAHADVEPDRDPDDYDEPTGSCENCGGNLYPDDDWDGLCNQCAWLAEQGLGGGD